MFICGLKTAASAPPQGVVARMARLNRVHGGATGGMSADILLAHCIAAAKVRRQSPRTRGAARQGLAQHGPNSSSSALTFAERDGDWAIWATSDTGGVPAGPLLRDEHHSQGSPHEDNTPANKVIADGPKSEAGQTDRIGTGCLTVQTGRIVISPKKWPVRPKYTLAPRGLLSLQCRNYLKRDVPNVGFGSPAVEPLF